MKKFISMVILVFTVISAFSVSTSAATVNPSVEPLWDNASLANSTMVFNGTEGNATMNVVGKSGVTKIEGYVEISKYDGSEWVYVTEASKTVTTRTCYLRITFTGEVGYEYKAEFTFTVYKDGVGEVITETRTEIC